MFLTTCLAKIHVFITFSDDIDDSDGVPEVSVHRAVSKVDFAGHPMDQRTATVGF